MKRRGHRCRHVRQVRQVRQAADGFTLIELAILLAVLAVLGAIALPSMAARLAHQRVLATAQALAADLADARFEAAQRGLPLQLQTRSGSTDWCWAVTTAPGCGCNPVVAPRQSCQLRNMPAAEHPGVRLLEGRDAQLDPTGGGSAQPVATLESARGEKLRVEVTALGRARICAVSGSWPQLQPC